MLGNERLSPSFRLTIGTIVWKRGLSRVLSALVYNGHNEVRGGNTTIISCIIAWEMLNVEYWSLERREIGWNQKVSPNIWDTEFFFYPNILGYIIIGFTCQCLSTSKLYVLCCLTTIIFYNIRHDNDLFTLYVLISADNFHALYSINCLELSQVAGALKHREIEG